MSGGYLRSKKASGRLAEAIFDEKWAISDEKWAIFKQKWPIICNTTVNGFDFEQYDEVKNMLFFRGTSGQNIGQTTQNGKYSPNYGNLAYFYERK